MPEKESTMGVTYNAREIYQIGVEIERNGQQFYRTAAERAEDSDSKASFEELANWEKSHVALFERLMEELPADAGESSIVDPDSDVQRYLKAAADSHVFLVNRDVVAMIDRCKDVGDVLRMALQFEKDSVVLYTSMKALVPEGLGANEIDKLIEEELSHVALLQDKLAAW
jgi:rubrerythrin